MNDSVAFFFNEKYNNYFTCMTIKSSAKTNLFYEYFYTKINV